MLEDEREMSGEERPDSEGGRVVTLRLGSWCVNACAHCKYRDDVRETAAFVRAFSPLAGRLPPDLGRGDTVLLDGPEPWRQPSFIPTIKRIRSSGAAIALYTTGRPFAERAMALRARRMGIRRFIVPVFGPDARRHDDVAGVPGAFKETRAGVANLTRLPGVELRLDVLVTPRDAALVAETVAAWREVAPAARLRLVHLLPIGGARRHPALFEGDVAALAEAVRPVLAADPSMTVAHFDERRTPWVAGRQEDDLSRDERFARLEKVDAACAGPLCASCAYEVTCAYFLRRRERRFDTYNLTVEAPCDLACGFCQRRFTDKAGREEPVESIVARFKRDTRDQDIPRVRVNGADPLAHPHLIEILGVVADRGVREVHLFTPGLLFEDEVFTERLFRALEPFDATVFPPIYGPDASVHDAIVGSEGAFDRLRRAMLQLQPYRDRVRFTTLVLKQNAEHLHEIYDLVVSEGFEMEPARFVRPFSDRPEDYAAVAPRMQDVVAFYKATGRPDVPNFLGLFGLAPCTWWDAFPTPEGLDQVEVDAGSYDVTGILRSHDQFRLKRDQVSRCDHPECAVYERCLNQVQYFQVYGFDEFRPLAPDGTFQAAAETEEMAQELEGD